MNVDLADPQFEEPQHEHCTSTRNACKLCTPLGACLVFRGIEGTIPFLHGSQGCSTYIRRYLISHFREPIDIAASNFSEESAVFGGRKNFTNGIKNVFSTCAAMLSQTRLLVAQTRAAAPITHAA